MLDPVDRETELTRFVTPRQPKGDRLCTADFFRPKASGELDVIALKAVTVGSEVTDVMAQLERDGEFAEQLFVHGLGVQTAEGLSEWLHWKVRGWCSASPPRRAGALVGLPRDPRAVRAPEGGGAARTSSRSA